MKKIEGAGPGYCAGQQRLAAERDAIDRVKARATLPDRCGPEVPVAPGRGAVRVVRTKALYPKGAREFEARPAGFMGRDTVVSLDNFDLMVINARKRGVCAPLTASQIATGRMYRDLVERHACAGVKCSSLEAAGGGGGSGGGFMDAVLRDRDEIDRLRRCIGSGSALVVRRVRPSSRGSRVTIMDRRLVDAVCLEEMSVSDVLRAHGWVVKGETVRALSRALAAGLDRMVGPVHGGIRATRFGADAPDVFGDGR